MAYEEPNVKIARLEKRVSDIETRLAKLERLLETIKFPRKLLKAPDRVHIELPVSIIDALRSGCNVISSPNPNFQSYSSDAFSVSTGDSNIIDIVLKDWILWVVGLEKWMDHKCKMSIAQRTLVVDKIREQIDVYMSG